MGENCTGSCLPFVGGEVKKLLKIARSVRGCPGRGAPRKNGWAPRAPGLLPAPVGARASVAKVVGG